MNFKRVEHIIIMTILLVLFSGILMAKTVPPKNTKISNETMNLINIAGKQRMLSQCIAKDYLYVGKNIALTKTQKESKESLETFIKAHKTLVGAISNPEIQNLLDFVELSSSEFKEIASKPFSLDNAQLILDLSESMLEGSQYVLSSLQGSFDSEIFTIIEKSSQSRMLSQRIAKYYIAYQSGIKDANTVKSMEHTVEKFNKNLTFLLKNKTNTPSINAQLEEVSKLWKIVHKFYNNIEKGGLPLIVFNTTDKITKKMDELTILYMAMYK